MPFERWLRKAISQRHHNSIFDAEIDDRYIAPVHIAMAIEMKLREVYVFAIVNFLSCIIV
jgi:hypothetical protein